MKKPDYYFYPAVFGYEPNEKISVVFPDLGVATSGEDDIDALKSAREFLGITMWGIEDDHEPIPEASKLNDVSCSETERVVLIDVYMPSVRLASNNKSVMKLFPSISIDIYTATRYDKLYKSYSEAIL